MIYGDADYNGMQPSSQPLKDPHQIDRPQQSN